MGNLWHWVLIAILSSMAGCDEVGEPDTPPEADDDDDSHITGPADLFDLAAIEAESLTSLGWTENGRTTVDHGVVAIDGDWNGGSFHTIDAWGEERSIELQERAVLYLPPGWPAAPRAAGLVLARHTSSLVEWEPAVEIAAGLGIPVLAHGEYAEDWETLGYAGRNDLVDATFTNLITANPCEPDDLTWGNFGWALVRTNLLAITLMQRLAEAEGGAVETVALRGGSKEGFATWIAAGVDPRIEVAAPGGYHLQDLDTGMAAYASDWGCEGSGAGGADVTDLLLSREWMLTTPAGNDAYAALSPMAFLDQLQPRFLLVAGDVTMADMHDGHYYPLGSETPFLDALMADHSVRYDRIPNDERESTTDRSGRLAGLIAERLLAEPGSEDDEYPAVVDAELEADGDAFRITADVAGPVDTVRLWWNSSPTRVWNDEDQTPWVELTLESTGGGTYTSDWLDAPADEEVAWYVEAERFAPLGPYDLARRDASPVRFHQRRPEVGCAIEAPAWCADD